MTPSVVWACLLAFVSTVAAITVLIVTGHDPGALVSFLAGIPAAVIGLAAYLRSGQTAVKVAEAGVTLDRVDKNVNGHLSRLTDAVLPPPAHPTEESTP